MMWFVRSCYITGVTEVCLCAQLFEAVDAGIDEAGAPDAAPSV
jgi:hypothetical protein